MAEKAATRRRRGYWVRIARERKGWTQKELAHALGYNGSQTGNLSKWESGERPIPSDLFAPLAQALDLPADFLVNPPLTDEDRLDAAIQSGIAAEQRDWEGEPDLAPKADDEPGDVPGRLSA